jgi:nitrogenase molybdenum-iron protein alpha/beta subunit
LTALIIFFRVVKKLERLLNMVSKEGHGLIAVINSPGAALIGDDLGGFLEQTIQGVPWFSLESAGFSGSFGVGCQTALAGAIETLTGKRRPAMLPKTVNLLVMGIYQKYYEGNRAALERLLALCGIQVIAAPGAGDRSAALARVGEAALNVVVYPEYGAALAQKLQAEYGTPFIIGEGGPPIGFDSTAALIHQICAVLNVDREAALSRINGARARAYRCLARFTAMLGFPRGALFSIKAEASTAYALTAWLCGYLGMIPAAISLTDGGDPFFVSKLQACLNAIHRDEALTSPIAATPTQVLLGDGNTIAELRLAGQKFCGIEIAMPSLSYIDVTEKSLFGEQGALFLLEQIINGLRYVLQ